MHDTVYTTACPNVYNSLTEAPHFSASWTAIIKPFNAVWVCCSKDMLSASSPLCIFSSSGPGRAMGEGRDLDGRRKCVLLHNICSLTQLNILNGELFTMPLLTITPPGVLLYTHALRLPTGYPTAHALDCQLHRYVIAHVQRLSQAGRWLNKCCWQNQVYTLFNFFNLCFP